MSLRLPPRGFRQVRLPGTRIGDHEWRTGKPAGRVGDRAQSEMHAHGCPACPHVGVGPAVTGSPDVFVNNRPALRVGDTGIASGCCGSNIWRARSGSSGVFIDGLPAHRKGDATEHCGWSLGTLIDGSPDIRFGPA